MPYQFKICDSVHGFIRFDEFEKKLIDSRPFQRLRYIHQMGAVYLIYPGATHTRFEHSLGVMEVVTRMYNILIEPHNQLVAIDKSREEIDYWRLILRLAALCHDMGHLPFSHTAEKSLLPQGGHEQMTLNIIHSEELRPIWREIGESAENDVAKLASSSSGYVLTTWEKMLSQLITEDNFGGDRIDYLIRDGHYTGVGYGHFDYQQLIDSLRIVQDQTGLTLGIALSGIQSVESLWIARYMMYSRVYQHPKARIYAYHLQEFMKKHFRTPLTLSVEDYLEHTDYTLLTALAAAAKEGDYDALCLLKRAPPYVEVPLYVEKPELLQALERKFERDVFFDKLPQKEMSRTFPVFEGDKVISSYEASSFLRDIPPGGKPYCLFVHPEKVLKVKDYLECVHKPLMA